jgi:hypothetical protein
MALERKIMLLPDSGYEQCCVIDIAHEPGTDIDAARVLGGCTQPPAGIVRHIGSGICAKHIQQFDEEGGFILENA